MLLLTTDGFTHNFLKTINGQCPIEAKKGDRIVINIHNESICKLQRILFMFYKMYVEIITSKIFHMECCFKKNESYKSQKYYSFIHM